MACDSAWHWLWAAVLLLALPGGTAVAQPTAVAPVESPAPTVVEPAAATPAAGKTAWGWVGSTGVFAGERVAPNGFLYDPLFTLDLDFNLWLCQGSGVYLFADNRFWTQRAAPGITNPSQGKWDFSKREYSFTGGLAWNFAGNFEARAFGYALSNLNRGTSPERPVGFLDGVGLEGRYYLRSVYQLLGLPGYDVLRSDFVSVGYLPSKTLVGGDGIEFNPGAFLRTYLTADLWTDKAYAYVDATLTAERVVNFRLLDADLGLAARPFAACPNLEFRLGAEAVWDFTAGTCRPIGYGAVRLLY